MKPSAILFVYGIIFVFLIIILLVAGCNPTEVHAEQINMSVIAQIESSGDPSAYNARTKASGLYQITPICLKDYLQFHPSSVLTMEDMLNPEHNTSVASWYLNKRIPQLLKHFKKPVTLDNVLISYNCGINCVIKNTLPTETRNYINKYKEQTQ